MMPQPENVVWALTGARAGDNAQVLALASRMPARLEVKQLSYNWLHRVPNILRGASLSGLKRDAARMIAPPWPDLVIAAGRRAAPVSLWIRAQSQGRTKIVHLGRPRSPLKAFDLVITTPQYGLPVRPNVVELPLPFASPALCGAEELAHWRWAWRELPRPLIAAAIGAAKFPLRFGRDERLRLARHLNELAKRESGSLVIIGAPRTERGAVEEIAAHVSMPHVAYPYGTSAGNPYRAALVEADRFTVTSDSVSMLADALATSRPVDTFWLPSASQWWAWDGRRGLGARLAVSGLLQPPRQVTRLVDQLIARGLVGELGGMEATKRVEVAYEDATGRVMGLLTSRSSQSGAA
jgi:uncharacterized protein